MNFRGLLGLLGVVAFIVLPNLVEFLIEWLWFGSSGYRSVYVTSLRAQASLFTFILGFAFLDALRQPVARDVVYREPVHPHRHAGAGTVQPSMIRREQIRKIVGIGSLVVSLMIAWPAAASGCGGSSSATPCRSA